MSGSYPDVNAESVNADQAAATAAITPALARFENSQADAAAFMAKHGTTAGSTVGWQPPDAAIGG